MLKNYWYAVEFADRVKEKPVRVRVFDQDLVLYRDSKGEVVCHSDICIHRGGSLADGNWLNPSGSRQSMVTAASSVAGLLDAGQQSHGPRSRIT